MKNPRETATGVVVIRIILSRSTNLWLVRGRPRISRTTYGKTVRRAAESRCHRHRDVPHRSSSFTGTL